jgi:chromosome partitioning protein
LFSQEHTDAQASQPVNTMPIIAVVNRKGGCGKSTLATNLAGWLVSRGIPVTLGDMDRQRSVRGWIQRRDPQAGPIPYWAVDTSRLLTAPNGISDVIVDTQSALYDYPLCKLIGWAEVIVVPVGPSLFDHDAALSFLQEVESHPRYVSGRCKLAVVGMRWSQEKVREWRTSGQRSGIAYTAAIPEHALYCDCLESGTSIFERDDANAQSEQVHWQPLLGWLNASRNGIRSPISGFTKQQSNPLPAQPQPQPQA